MIRCNDLFKVHFKTKPVSSSPNVLPDYNQTVIKTFKSSKYNIQILPWSKGKI